MKKFWRRLTDRDKLCYALVIAFGVCLLAIMLFFSFGYQLGERQIKPFITNEETTTEQKLLLIDEPNQVVRGIEMGVAVGMIVLGTERLRSYKRRSKQ